MEKSEETMVLEAEVVNSGKNDNTEKMTRNMYTTRQHGTKSVSFDGHFSCLFCKKNILPVAVFVTGSLYPQ